MRKFCRELAIQLAYFLWLPITSVMLVVLGMKYADLLILHPQIMIPASVLLVGGGVGYVWAHDQEWFR